MKVGRPKTLEEAQAMVTNFDRVKGVGVGHSWWKEQFCSGEDDKSINLVMTELESTLNFIQDATDPKEFNGEAPPADFPIQVDEEAGEVTVAAGVPQRMLLEYLSEYKYGSQPEGWVLPAFSWFVDQTIGGAVATGTHGSSFQHGSLSSQVTSLRLLLANGTIVDVSPSTYPHLFDAAGVSVGRLGVITDLTLKIKPQQAVTRNLKDIDITQFAAEIKAVQEEFKDAKSKNDNKAIKNAMSRLDETQALWHVASKAVWRTDYEYLDKEPESVLMNIEFSPDISAFDAVLENVFDPEDTKDIGKSNAITSNARMWANIYGTTMRGFVNPGTYAASKAFISMTESGNTQSSTMQPYDQFEVAVPLEKAGDCMIRLSEQIYGPKNLWEGFRTPALVRFISGEPFYLSPSNGGPVMYGKSYIYKASL